MTPAQMLAEFLARCPDGWDATALRQTLHREEWDELREAMGDIRLCEVVSKSVPVEAIEHLAKELADVAYVLWGTAAAFGISLERAFEIVHEDNMAKLAAGTTRSDGKLEKPRDWTAPDMSGAIQ